MFAAEVWTYWLAPPLLATALTLLIVTLVGYYRKVAVPEYLAEQQRQIEAMRTRHQLKPAPSAQPAALPLRRRSGGAPPGAMPLAA